MHQKTPESRSFSSPVSTERPFTLPSMVLKKQQPPQLDMDSLELPNARNRRSPYAGFKVKRKSVEDNKPWAGNNEQPIATRSPSKLPTKNIMRLKKSNSTEDAPQRVSTPTVARDSLGHPLSGLKQVRIKTLQKDLLQLVKEAERSGCIKVMKRKETECISMPGHGIIRLAPPGPQPPRRHLSGIGNHPKFYPS